VSVALPAAVTVRRVSAKDAAAVARVMGDPDIYPGLMQLPFPDEERLRAWITDMSQPGRTDLFVLAERAGEVVGTAGLHPAHTSLRRRHAVYLGISMVERNQGVGSALMQALCDYADRWAHVLRTELTVFADNAAAIALYRKFGFEVEGTHRAYALRDGVYVDALAMARLHPDPPSLTTRSGPSLSSRGVPT
jgi:putative acetyltransferase